MDWKAFDAARNLAADKIRTEHAFESTTPTEAILLMLVDMLAAEVQILAGEIDEILAQEGTETYS